MIYISLDRFRCHTETDEVGSDEPYIIVAAVDLSSNPPGSRAFLYGAFEDVDQQETHGVPFLSFWGLNGEERALPNPDDAVFIVGLMENDDGNPVALRGIVAAQVNSEVFATLGITDRALRVGRLMQAFASAQQVPTGGPSTDEVIGLPQELRFTPQEVALAETGQPAERSLRFMGDGGDYTLTFQARNRGQAAWRFCAKCHTLFFDGDPTGNKGVCPAGGGHAAAGFVFYLPHDRPGPLGGQLTHHCMNCFAMFQKFLSLGGAVPIHDICPAGGRHKFHPESFEFFLPHDHSGPGQDEWRLCENCHVIFWNGEANKGVCAAGGSHHAPDNSFNFKLDFTP